jgi:dihydrofolate reductase
VQSLLAAGLVDELQLRVLPIMLSSGRRLISEGSGEHRMALLQATPFSSGILALRYAVGQSA